MSAVTMREMLEAGVHFGHQTRFWNPKMGPYLYGQRNKIHIINLEKTLPLFTDAINFAGKISSKKGNVLFVGTKRAARKIIQEEAERCGMPYINHRWLGGLLTNFKTVRQSISRLKELEAMESDGSMEKISKKEVLLLRRELDKLKVNLAGIKDMPGIPDAIFIIDVGYEDIAVSEAVKLGIPVIGVVDSNNSPHGVDYVIPGNDDAIRSIRLYTKAVADAIVDGRGATAHLGGSGDADDFVELDETGAPIVDSEARKAKSPAKKRTVRKKTATASKDEGGQEAAADSESAEKAEPAAADTAVIDDAGSEVETVADSKNPEPVTEAEAETAETADKDEGSEAKATKKKTAAKKTTKKTAKKTAKKTTKKTAAKKTSSKSE